MIFLLLACSGSSEGTIVGNPGDAMTVAAAPKGLEVVDGQLAWSDLWFQSCSGNQTDVLAGGDALTLGQDALILPAGTWCSMTFGEAELDLQLRAEDDTNVDLTLSLSGVDLGTGAVEVDGGSWLIELGEPGWLDVEDLGGDTVIDDTHPARDDLAEAIASRSALFLDDGDGALSQDERDAGPYLSGRSRDQTADTGPRDTGAPDSPGSCGVVPAGGFWLCGLLLLASRRTRRERG